MDESDTKILPVLPGIAAPVSSTYEAVLPRLIADAGDAARFAYEEFVFGRLRNPFTRRNYQHAVDRFLAWCEGHRIVLTHVMPKHVGLYIDELAAAPSTKKLHLAALRHFFDELVTRHAVLLNPAASVRGERYQVVEGKTPELSVDQARSLLRSIGVSDIVDLRDKAIIGILIYTAARVGAVAKLTRGDLYDTGDQHCLRFLDKGGKSREIPVRHDLQGILFSYLDTATLGDADRHSALFRTVAHFSRELTDRRMTANDIGRMVKRRMREAGLPNRLSCHSLRVTTITDLLSQGIRLEDVQQLAGHADPRTTRLYDRRQRTVTRNIVERISI
jgi:site-specific recombinase XerD